MEKTNTCPISDEPAEALPKTGGYHEFDCPSCGRFRISDTAWNRFKQCLVARERLFSAKPSVMSRVVRVCRLLGTSTNTSLPSSE